MDAVLCNCLAVAVVAVSDLYYHVPVKMLFVYRTGNVERWKGEQASLE